MLQVLLGCSVLPRRGIHQYDDPGPPLVSAKLHYCYSNAVCGLLRPRPPLPSRLPPFCLVWFVPFVRLVWFLLLGCCFSCLVGFVVPSDSFDTLPCPHLGTRRLELRVDCESLLICLFDWLLTKVIWPERH